MRLFLLTVVLVAVAGCRVDTAEEPQRTSFVMPTDPASLYAVRLWDTQAETQRSVIETVRSQPAIDGATGEMLLSCRPGTAVVQIVTFPSASAAAAYLAATPEVRPDTTRQFSIVSHSRKPGAPEPTTFTQASSVQYSEFRMFQDANADELQSIVRDMHATMAEGGAQPTLSSIAQLRSSDGRTLGMLADWSTRDGFEVFARERTFQEPYWGPYAENAHWMCDVASVR